MYQRGEGGDWVIKNEKLKEKKNTEQRKKENDKEGS